MNASTRQTFASENSLNYEVTIYQRLNSDDATREKSGRRMNWLLPYEDALDLYVRRSLTHRGPILYRYVLVAQDRGQDQGAVKVSLNGMTGSIVDTSGAMR